MDKSVKVEIAKRGGNCEIITLAFTLDLTAGGGGESRRAEVSPMETVVSRNYTTQQQHSQRGPRQSKNPGYRQCRGGEGRGGEHPLATNLLASETTRPKT